MIIKREGDLLVAIERGNRIATFDIENGKFIGNTKAMSKLHERGMPLHRGLIVERAKEILRNEGYFVDNIWHIEDVKGLEDAPECITDEECQEVLKNAFKNEATYDQIWMSINVALENSQVMEEKYTYK